MALPVAEGVWWREEAKAMIAACGRLAFGCCG